MSFIPFTGISYPEPYSSTDRLDYFSNVATLEKPISTKFPISGQFGLTSQAKLLIIPDWWHPVLNFSFENMSGNFTISAPIFFANSLIGNHNQIIVEFEAILHSICLPVEEYTMKTDDELNYENEPRQMLSRVMHIGQILAGSLDQQSKPVEKVNKVHLDSHSLDNYTTPRANELDTKTRE